MKNAELLGEQVGMFSATELVNNRWQKYRYVFYCANIEFYLVILKNRYVTTCSHRLLDRFIYFRIVHKFKVFFLFVLKSDTIFLIVLVKRQNLHIFCICIDIHFLNFVTIKIQICSGCGNKYMYVPELQEYNIFSMITKSSRMK